MDTAYISRRFRSRRFLFIAAAAAVALVSAALAPQLAISSSVVFDTFKDKKNTPLESHTPNVAPEGSFWKIELGKWVIKKGAVEEKSKTKENISSDYRAVINTGLSEYTVSAKIKDGKGKQFRGVVADHTDPLNWTMWFYDGVGDLVLGAKIGGGFEELGRAKFKWKKGRRHVMSLTVTADEIIASIGGNVVIKRDNPFGTGSSFAGIFMRGGGSTKIEEFTVTGT